MVICHYYEQGQGLPASLSLGQLAELRRVLTLRGETLLSTLIRA
jgi:hypothetical protein